MEPLEKSINQTDQAIDLVKQTIENTNRLKAEKEALRAENTRLKEALEPMLTWIKTYHNNIDVSNEKELGLYTAYQSILAALNPKPL
jgi:regulator of replication initiation timing